MNSSDLHRLLDDFLEARRHRPFQWGTHDCCLFAADWVLALTGWDPAAGLRGTYATALEACRVARDLPSLADMAILPAGWGVCPPPKAPRGSICAVLSAPGRHSLGVLAHPWGVFVGPKGLEFIPRNLLILTWSPPCLK